MTHILIIEDDQTLQKVYSEVLKKHEFEVITVGNGPDGMAAVSKNQIDLILLDIMLPGGMNGFEVLTQLQKDDKYKAIPVVIMTNLDSEKHTGIELGAVDYIFKPEMNLSDLVQKVQQHLPQGTNPTQPLRKILIVEDDPLLQSMYRKFLSNEGLDVHIAGTGTEALDFLSKEPNRELILLDIMMPGGMNGFDVLMRLKQNPQLKDIPVIIMSNLDSERSTGLDMGAVDYFVKADTELPHLLEKIKEHLPVGPGTK